MSQHALEQTDDTTSAPMWGEPFPLPRRAQQPEHIARYATRSKKGRDRHERDIVREKVIDYLAIVDLTDPVIELDGLAEDDSTPAQSDRFYCRPCVGSAPDLEEALRQLDRRHLADMYDPEPEDDLDFLLFGMRRFATRVTKKDRERF
jgi:hypothetical protein